MGDCPECKIFAKKKQTLIKIIDESIDSLNEIVKQALNTKKSSLNESLSPEGRIAYFSMLKIQKLLEGLNHGHH